MQTHLDRIPEPKAKLFFKKKPTSRSSPPPPRGHPHVRS
jgi:hypothetical protein